MLKIAPYLLNLAGEYRVCSELNKRGVFATVTYGNRKGVDVYAINDETDRAFRIEVKTSQRKKFVTSIGQKGLDKGKGPDFWVLFHLSQPEESCYEERFFILTHEEIVKAQAKRNAIHAEKYIAKHGKQPNVSLGVDNVRISVVEQYEDQWIKITAAIKATPERPRRS